MVFDSFLILYAFSSIKRIYSGGKNFLFYVNFYLIESCPAFKKNNQAVSYSLIVDRTVYKYCI